MQELKKQLKEKNINGIYLFYGEESFLIHSYLDRLVSVLFLNGDPSMNLESFSEGVDMNQVVDGVNTFPFLGDKRAVILKNCGLFKKKNSKKAEVLTSVLENMPDTTVLVIIEPEVDKRTKFFKKIKELGLIVEFKKLDTDDLVKYIARRLNKVDKKIETRTATYLIDVVGHDLSTINNELDKLIDYTGANEVVYNHDIDEICTKSIENRIFELVDSIGNRQKNKALSLFEDLIFLKEPPTRILYMITRQFRILLQIKLLKERNLSNSEIAKKIKQAPFVVNKCSRQISKFTKKQLKQALEDCLMVEADFKHGQIDILVGVEMLISDYSKVSKNE